MPTTTATTWKAAHPTTADCVSALGGLRAARLLLKQVSDFLEELHVRGARVDIALARHGPVLVHGCDKEKVDRCECDEEGDHGADEEREVELITRCDRDGAADRAV